MQQTKKTVPVALKAILIYIGSAILGLILSGPFGKMYRLIEGPYKGAPLGVLFDKYTNTFFGGLVYGYFLFLGL